MITLRNKFDALKEISEILTPNDQCENFVNAHIEAVAECLPTKLKAKHRVLLETLAVKKKFDDMKTASVCNKRNPTNPNNQKFKKAQSELNYTYLKEQTEYIQDQINKSRDLVEDK